MRIFISYGHDFVDEAKIIVESFKALGHEVWVDYEKIQPGDDWRDSITEGILSADVVLAMLSEHGLREGGVCLDELAIAVSCNRRNIRPVLMENGAMALIPACISGIQIFDLSLWRSLSESQFDEWYKNKFEELVELYLKKPSVYEQKLASIKNKLHLSSQFSRELFELGKGFQKREWLDEKISEWVKSDDGNVCIFVGFPGFGKSCYCTNYYHYGDDVAGLVFCDVDDGKYNGVISAIKETSFSLAVRIPSFATRLDRILCNPDVSIDTTPEKLFELIIMEPCNLIDLTGERAVVILDAVDKLSENGENRLAKLILGNANRLPPYIKVILFCRNDESLLGGTSSVYKIVPDAKSEKIFEDIKEYVVSEHDSPLGEEAQKLGVMVAEKSQGSFLYASAVNDSIKAGKFSLQTDALPEKVSDVYFSWINQIASPKEYEEKYLEAIAVLSAIENPSVDFIKRVLGWKQSDVTEFIKRFSVLLLRNVNKFGKTCVSFYSKSFADWVKDEEKAGGYYASEEDGYAVIAQYFRDAYDEEELTDYDYVIIIDVLRKAGKNKFLRVLSSDDDFFDESFDIVEKLERNADFYPEWTSVLEGLEFLIDKFELNDDKARKVTYFKAKGEFLCGDLLRSGKILDGHEELFESGEHDEKYYDYLYMSGTVCDFVGERKRSVEKFLKLLKEVSQKNTDFEIKAIAGLVWNGHFNDIEGCLKQLKRLDGIAMDEEQSTTKNLLKARVLLSAGRLDEALALFEKVIDGDFDVLWNYDVIARKNQTLAIEAIVSAYDAGKLDLAVRFGEKILEKLKGMGSISECYCLSWLAIAEDERGNKDKAYAYLDEAKNVFSMGNEESSKWLNMHLKSVEAKFCNDKGKKDESLALYKEVEKLATECDDAWVRGDACFDIIAIRFIAGERVCLNDYYVETLFCLADKTSLPHLTYKKRIINIILGGEKLLNYEEIPLLASVIPSQIATLLYIRARADGLAFAEKYKDIKGK